LGFRLEFEPGFISRLKPLSGFIVEVDQCDQSGTVSLLPSPKSLHTYLFFVSLPA
jgi:hypothetical protein